MRLLRIYFSMLTGILVLAGQTPIFAQEVDAGVSARSLWASLTDGRGGRGDNRSEITRYTYERFPGLCGDTAGAVVLPGMEIENPGGVDTPDLLIIRQDGLAIGGNCIGASTPLPPTSEQVRDAIPFPVPEIYRRPDRIGLTGLETSLWTDGIASLELPPLSLNGYRVTATATLVGFYWRTGDGYEAVTYTPGSAVSPAVKHIYETKGGYTLELEVAWRASYAVSGFGITAGPFDLGPVVIGVNDDYLVQEVRSVLSG